MTTQPRSSDLIVPVPNVSPITPSQRLPLIWHALREAGVMYVECRYEGRGGTGGYVLEYQDRHRKPTFFSIVAEQIQQQLTGFLWQLILRRYPTWDEGPGSFGVLTWDLRADRIRHFHHQRIIDVKTSLVEGL
jgi:hypothetical protein